MSSSASGRSSYLLIMSLMVPMCTAVLVVFYFAKFGGAPDASDLSPGDMTKLNLVVTGAGLSALMAILLDVSLLVVYRQRNRFERLQRRQKSFLDDMLEERLRMARALDVLSACQQVTLAIKQETSFERISSVVLEQIEAFSRADDVVVFVTGVEGELEARARRFNGINTFGTTVDSESLELELPYEALVKNQVARHYNKPSSEYAVSIPFATTDGLRGVVLVRRNTADDPDFEHDLAQFESALVQLVKGVSVGLKFSAIWDRAIKDEMTGLFNKNHFNKEMPRLLKESLKQGRSFSMVMLDIDKFKHVNDTYGHLPGDQILRQVAGILIENLRAEDMAFRYGGEELCLICNNTVDEDAAAFGERLRSMIAHTEFRTDSGQLIPITASFGVTEFDPRTMQSETEMKLACDEALYHAKENGRNAVVIASKKPKSGKTSFEMLARSGDVSSEVKRRLGLAGDNTPLDEAMVLADRRKTKKTKRGKVAKALEEQPALADSIFDEPEKSEDKDTNTAIIEAQTAAKAGRSIKALAEQIIKAAEGSSERLEDVARIAEVAAVAISESRRTPALKTENDCTSEEKSSAASSAKKKAAQQRRTRKKAGTKPAGTSSTTTKKRATSKKTTKKKTVRKKAASKRNDTRVSAPKKAVEARIEAEKQPSHDSDRLDYLTEQEASELLDGKAPSKRTHATSSPATESTASEWEPKKHW